MYLLPLLLMTESDLSTLHEILVSVEGLADFLYDYLGCPDGCELALVNRDFFEIFNAVFRRRWKASQRADLARRGGLAAEDVPAVSSSSTSSSSSDDSTTRTDTEHRKSFRTEWAHSDLLCAFGEKKFVRCSRGYFYHGWRGCGFVARNSVGGRRESRRHEALCVYGRYQYVDLSADLDNGNYFCCPVAPIGAIAKGCETATIRPSPRFDNTGQSAVKPRRWTNCWHLLLPGCSPAADGRARDLLLGGRPPRETPVEQEVRLAHEREIHRLRELLPLVEPPRNDNPASGPHNYPEERQYYVDGKNHQDSLAVERAEDGHDRQEGQHSYTTAREDVPFLVGDLGSSNAAVRKHAAVGRGGPNEELVAARFVEGLNAAGTEWRRRSGRADDLSGDAVIAFFGAERDGTGAAGPRSTPGGSKEGVFSETDNVAALPVFSETDTEDVIPTTAAAKRTANSFVCPHFGCSNVFANVEDALSCSLLDRRGHFQHYEVGGYSAVVQELSFYLRAGEPEPAKPPAPYADEEQHERSSSSAEGRQRPVYYYPSLAPSPCGDNDNLSLSPQGDGASSASPLSHARTAPRPSAFRRANIFEIVRRDDAESLEPLLTSLSDEMFFILLEAAARARAREITRLLLDRADPRLWSHALDHAVGSGAQEVGGQEAGMGGEEECGDGHSGARDHGKSGGGRRIPTEIWRLFPRTALWWQLLFCHPVGTKRRARGTYPADEDVADDSGERLEDSSRRPFKRNSTIRPIILPACDMSHMGHVTGGEDYRTIIPHQQPQPPEESLSTAEFRAFCDDADPAGGFVQFGANPNASATSSATSSLNAGSFFRRFPPPTLNPEDSTAEQPVESISSNFFLAFPPLRTALAELPEKDCLAVLKQMSNSSNTEGLGRTPIFASYPDVLKCVDYCYLEVLLWLSEAGLIYSSMDDCQLVSRVLQRMVDPHGGLVARSRGANPFSTPSLGVAVDNLVKHWFERLILVDAPNSDPHDLDPPETIISSLLPHLTELRCFVDFPSYAALWLEASNEILLNSLPLRAVLVALDDAGEPPPSALLSRVKKTLEELGVRGGGTGGGTTHTLSSGGKAVLTREQFFDPLKRYLAKRGVDRSVGEAGAGGDEVSSDKSSLLQRTLSLFPAGELLRASGGGEMFVEIR